MANAKIMPTILMHSPVILMGFVCVFLIFKTHKIMDATFAGMLKNAPISDKTLVRKTPRKDKANAKIAGVMLGLWVLWGILEGEGVVLLPQYWQN